MKKLIFFFLLFLPLVNAISVMPVNLELNSLEDKEQFTVYNNLKSKVEYSITSEVLEFRPSKFELKKGKQQNVIVKMKGNGNEKKIYDILITEKASNDKGVIIENSVTIKADLKIATNKTIVKENKITSNVIKVEDSKMEKNIFFGLLGLVILIIIGKYIQNDKKILQWKMDCFTNKIKNKWKKLQRRIIN